jgi:diaminopimelate decarboxylase
VSGLLDVAKQLELNVVGVSFHVGSGCSDPSVFERAIAAARSVFDIATNFGFTFCLLDIGGGFPGSSGTSINKVCFLREILKCRVAVVIMTVITTTILLILLLSLFLGVAKCV